MSAEPIVIGLKELSDDLDRLSEDSRHDVLMAALEAGARTIQIYAQENARQKLNKHPLGFLTNSIGVRKAGNVWEVGVFGVIYAKIHEFGGVITPRTKKFLSWIDPDSGRRIFTKQAVIPARPYLRPAVDEHRDEIHANIVAAILGILRGGL